jgi:hypothetical protein
VRLLCVRLRQVMMKRSKRILKIGVGAIAALGLAWMLALYSVTEPDTKLGYGVFRIVYSSPVSKGWLLRKFSQGLKDHNGGYIGEPVDKFLCSRLEKTDSDRELAAIVEFYILQAGGREGDNIGTLSDEAKEKVIGFILEHIESYEKGRAEGALLIVEQLRRGVVLPKASFGKSDYAGLGREDKFDYERWWYETGLPETKAKYREWWNIDLAWQTKKAINPLEGSNIRVGFLN